ncbi:MAG: malic enzyme-like NAD(P)-binding protein [Pirellulales bacterium]
MFDVDGLLTKNRTDLSPSQRGFAQALQDTAVLENAVRQFQPTILIGVSTIGGLFTEAVVKAMHAGCPRPIIFPLSNPTDHAEATAEQLYRWTDGRALVAAGVQFPDTTIDGRTFHPGQANNFYIYPALAMAVYATQPKRINDAMFIAAAHGSAGSSESTRSRPRHVVPAPRRDSGDRDHHRDARGRIHLRSRRSDRGTTGRRSGVDRIVGLHADLRERNDPMSTATVDSHDIAVGIDCAWHAPRIRQYGRRRRPRRQVLGAQRSAACDTFRSATIACRSRSIARTAW